MRHIALILLAFGLTAQAQAGWLSTDFLSATDLAKEESCVFVPKRGAYIPEPSAEGVAEVIVSKDWMTEEEAERVIERRGMFGASGVEIGMTPCQVFWMHSPIGIPDDIDTLTTAHGTVTTWWYDLSGIKLIQFEGGKVTVISD